MIGRAGSAVLLAGLLAAGSAQAQLLAVAGSLSGGYSNYDTPGSNLSEWRGAGSGVLTIDNPGVNVQVNFGNSGLKVAGQSADLWRYDGDVYFRDRKGAIGFDGGGDSVSAGIASTTSGSKTQSTKGFDFVHYGVFGEFFMLDSLTMRMRGGRVDGNQSGWYASLGTEWYPLSSIGVSVTGDYIKLDSPSPTVSDVGIQAEYMPVREVPVTLQIGYTYAHLSQLGGHQDILSAGVKWYFGGEGRSGTLVDRQRNGADDWAGPPPSLVGVGF